MIVYSIPSLRNEGRVFLKKAINCDATWQSPILILRLENFFSKEKILTIESSLSERRNVRKNRKDWEEL